MRTAVLGGLVIVALAVAAVVATTAPNAVFAERAGSQSSGLGVVTHAMPLGDSRQQLTIIDPGLHVMSVYHVESNGEIVLKSVRNFHFDLQMMEFNSAKPTPQEIRSLLEQR